MTGLATAQSPDYGPAANQEVQDAVVMVVASGVNTALGNKREAVQGTGFFVSSDGRLVTSYHLREKLPAGVDAGTIKYTIYRNPFDTSPRPAAMVYGSELFDVLVLYVDVSGLTVKPLRQGSKDGDNVKVLQPVYTGGFPANYSYQPDVGVLKSFSGPVLDPPRPLYVTSITYKEGQSGSPILLANGKVIGIAKATDPGANSIGLIVPSWVAQAYWGGVSAASELGTIDQAPKVRVQIPGSSARVECREVPFTLSNLPCAGAQSHELRIDATPNWRIVGQVELKTVNLVGTVRILDQVLSSDGSSVAMKIELANAGTCGVLVGSDTPAVLYGAAVLMEAPPSGGQPTSITLKEVVAGEAGAKTIRLDERAANAAAFSVVKPNGETVPFEPMNTELRREGVGRVLDVTKVLSRVLDE